MAAVEHEIAVSETRAIRPIGEAFVMRTLTFACSVRLGVILLTVLVVICCIGMVVMQQNVEGFQSYYAALSPAQRLVFERLGFFSIYHSWYFKALLSLLSINIILASIDRFPKSWQYISKPQISVPLRWLEEQDAVSAFELEGAVGSNADRVRAASRDLGFRRVLSTEANGRTYILAESGAWNRLGAYPVHLGLLTILLGGFLSSQTSTGGMLELGPGEATSLITQNVVALDNVNKVTKRLPFEIEVTDIEHKLIRRDGPLTPENTIDWITRFRIKDEGNVQDAMVQLNQPYDYRGYRFFQSDFSAVVNARRIVLEAKHPGGVEKVEMPRGGSVTLRNGDKVEFASFRANSASERPNENTTEYRDPRAVLTVRPVNGESYTTYAGMTDAQTPLRATGGLRFRLVGFEPVSEKHTLSVQRDPGSGIVYTGFAFLTAALAAVFFFSHQRVWIVLDESTGGTRVLAAGESNRDPERSRATLQKLIRRIKGT